VDLTRSRVCLSWIASRPLPHFVTFEYDDVQDVHDVRDVRDVHDVHDVRDAVEFCACELHGFENNKQVLKLEDCVLT
jgi:hypothetical protein